MENIDCKEETWKLDSISKGEGFCQNCKKSDSIFKIPSQNKKWCKDCFLQFFEKRIRRTIEKYRMLGVKYRIGVSLSGGKDSASLLWALKRIYADVVLYGIHINLGIGYYSDIAEETVRELCKKIEVPLYIYNLKKEKGFSIDDFIFTHYKRKICAVCGNIKRYLLSTIAKELKLDVLATGHHLDDLVSTSLSLFFSGDFSSLLRLSPTLPPLIDGQARKVKPLCTSPESEIFYYSLFNQLPLENYPCPHKELTPSKKLKKNIEELEKENSQIKYQLFSLFNKKLIPLIRLNKKEEIIGECKKCGELTDSSEQICSFCKKVMLLEKIPERRLEFSLREFLEKKTKLAKNGYAIFDLREKEDFEKDTLLEAKWIPSEYIEKDYKETRKLFKPFKGKTLFFYGDKGITRYHFVLKLRKMGFEVYSIKPEYI